MAFETRHEWISYYNDRVLQTIESQSGVEPFAGRFTFCHYSCFDSHFWSEQANPFIIDQSTVAAVDARKIKDAWISKQLRQKESMFTDFENIR